MTRDRRPHSRLGGLPLLVRHATAAPTAGVLVALLIAVAVLAVALAPRAVAAMSTAELRATIGALVPVARDLNGSARLAIERGPQDDAPTSAADALSGVSGAIEGLRDDLEPPLRDVVGTPDWLVVGPPATVGFPESDDRDVLPRISLAVDLEWTSRVRMVEGDAPAAWTGDDGDETAAVDRPPIEVAIARDVADVQQVAVGDLLPYEPAPLLVTGLYDPVDPGADYWSHVPLLAQAALDRGSGGPSIAVGSAYVEPDSLLGLQRSFASGQVTAWAPIDPTLLVWADAPTLAEQLRSAGAIGVSLPNGEQLQLSSGTTDRIDESIVRITAVTALLTLTASAPLGVLLAVFAMGVGSVIDRRRPALALASARGASPWALRGAMLLEGLVLAVPGTVVAILLAAALLPERVGPDAIVLPALLGLAPPVLFAVATPAIGLRTTRADLSPRARGRVRWIVEVAVAGLAAVALLLLWRRGLVASADAVGVDPLLAATPLLLAVAVCLGVLRLYPFAMLWLQRRMRARRGVIGLVGAARGVRDPVLGFPAAFALVVGVSVAVFAGVMGSTVDTALRTAAIDEIGADIRVEANDLGEDVVGDVAAVDGVDAVAGLATSSRQRVGSQRGELDVPIVFADTEALHEVRSDVPAGMSELQDGRVPVLASSELAARIDGIGETVNDVEGVPVGSIPSGSIPATPDSWVLVDAGFRERIVGSSASPDRLLIRVAPGADPAVVADAVRTVVADAQRGALADAVRVLDRGTMLATAQSSPTIGGLRTALLVAVLGAVLLAGLALVLGSITASGARNRTVGVLRTLGLSPRQAGGLIAWELGPVVITALLAGTALGIALPWIVTAALDLRPFVGGLAAPTPAADPLLLAALLGGFLAVAVVAGGIAVAIGRRLVPAGTLKMGAE